MMLKRNMWDHADYHCPIVGTCLTTAELRKLASRVQLVLPHNASDYELHGCFVTLAKRPEKPAKIVQKFLDRKFSRQMKRFAKAEGDEALWSLWTEMADAGDIPGAFWAVMRHQGASEKLLAQIYGEVHMLSHLVGASTRADLRRLAEAQARVEKLGSALAERKTVLRDAVAVWKRRTLELERELTQERARREKLERERLSLRELLETRSVAELEGKREALAAQLEDLQDRLVVAQAEARRQTLIIETSYREESYLRSQLAERDREVEALELALLEGLQPKPPCGGACDDPAACPCPHLRGKCVLYVGGRSGLKGQYRLLGERFGCEVLHHDGGVEQSPQHLQQLLSRADAVVCPVDCVSHEACALVKRMCKGSMKPVLFARSSGLSSLASSLAALDKSCQ
ncbi:MAG TPA: DUF2325 domain-containing protein [Humidesulfovibrio sp.]|uniref:DUF2325 domain-containing protein n=1 Tax=Humidesulfovibrio sp. TaxID=2910988 RepID=UPI002CF8E931|nr:DUF2325 domain-containing protein [Humidesulfovibrio sp.]HWR04998.1 DUF2325 domain-containing protein [Humidesulfovibrio sp.]